MIRYALSRTTNDRFPIHFKPDCERTIIGDTSLVDIIEQLETAGYDLINSRKELIKRLERRGLKAENGWQDI